MSWTVRLATLEEDDLEAIASVVAAVTPEYTTSVDEMRWDTADTGNDVANGPMRAINARLGYEPLPDEISMRGPLHPGIMGR